MKMTVGPYHNSPYDASGMPLGCETVDYDKVEDVAKATVKDKPVKHPQSINDIDYQPKQLPKKFTGQDERYITKKGFNSAIVDPDVENMPVADTADFDDPDEKRKLIVKDAFVKDQAVPELPKVEKDKTVNKVAEEVKKDEEAKEDEGAKEPDTDFLKAFEDKKEEK